MREMPANLLTFNVLRELAEQGGNPCLSLNEYLKMLDLFNRNSYKEHAGRRLPILDGVIKQNPVDGGIALADGEGWLEKAAAAGYFGDEGGSDRLGGVFNKVAKAIAASRARENNVRDQGKETSHARRR